MQHMSQGPYVVSQIFIGGPKILMRNQSISIVIALLKSLSRKKSQDTSQAPFWRERERERGRQAGIEWQAKVQTDLSTLGWQG